MSQSWAEVASGVYGNPELSEETRFEASLMTTLSDLVDPATDFFVGKQSGDSVSWRQTGRISGVATTPLGEYQKIPMSKPPIYEGSATVSRYGTAVPTTKLREDLDRLDVNDTTIHALKEHSARTHNALIYAALKAGRSFSYTPTSASAATITEDGTCVTTMGAALNGYHIRNIRKKFMTWNVPPVDGSTFWAALSPTAYMNLFSDTDTGGWVDVQKYSPTMADGLMKGEVGSYHQFRFSVDNHILDDGVGTSSAYGTGFFVGWEACKEVSVYPMELLMNDNLGGQFGDQKAIAWVSLLTYAVIWDYATHGQGSVLHYTDQAV